MVNVRRGINIRTSFALQRNGIPEDLSQAQNLRVVIRHKCQPNSAAAFAGSAVKVDGNSVSVVITDTMQKTMASGDYLIEVAYRLINPAAPEGYDPYIIDSDVFTLTDRSADVGGASCGDVTVQVVNLTGEVSFCSQALEQLIDEAIAAVQSANEAAQNANDAADAAMAIVDSKVDIDGLNANVKRLQFDTTNPTAPMQIGQIAWDNDEHTLVTHDGLHSHPLGKELELRARNTSGVAILNGRACYVTGSTGDNPTIALATNTDGDVAQKTIGVATIDIANNAFGIVTTFGEVNDIDTSALTLGAIVYLGANGLLTTTEPVAPTPKIVIGICVRQHAQVGKLFVSTRPIARLSKLSEVYAPALTDNDVLKYNGTTLRWEVYSLANKADLVAGKVPTSQLPSYVDDVLEYANLADFPVTGETGKIYVALNTNLTYRWSGTAYVEISKSLALGETADTAYRGDRGKTAYDHSQTTGNPHNTTAAQIPNTPAGTVAATTVQGAINELAGDIVQVKTQVDQIRADLNTIHENGIVESFRYNYVNNAYDNFSDLNNLSLRHITTDSNELFTLKTNTASYGHILQSVNFVSGNKYIIYVELNVKNIYYDKNIDIRLITQGAGMFQPMKIGRNYLIYRFTSTLTENKATYIQFPLSGGLPATSDVPIADFNLNKLIVIIDEGQTDDELLLYNELSYKASYNSMYSVYSQKSKTAEGLDELKSNAVTSFIINSNYNFNGNLLGWSRNNTIYSICTFDENNILTWEGQYTGAAYPDIRRTVNLTPGKYYAVVKANVLSIDSQGARFVLSSSPTTFYSTYNFNFVGEEILMFTEVNLTESKTPLVFLQIAGGAGLIQGQKIASVELYYFAIIESPTELSKSDILSVLNDGYMSYSKKSLSTENIYPSLIGRKWNAIGDSITAQATYILPVLNYFKFLSCKNISAGGKSISGAASVPNPRMWEDAVINQIEPDAWLITIMGGTNDWASNALIGTNEDTDGLTFKGAVKLVIQKISTLYPKSRLVFCGCPYGELYDKPLSAGWANSYTNLLGLTTRDYANAAKEVCEIYGIPFADIIGNAGWNTYNIRTFVKDDGGLLHPLPDGGERIASVIRGVVSDILPKTVDNY